MEKSKKVMAIIRQRGLTVKRVAEMSGLKHTTLDSMLKRGIGGSKVDNVIKLCKALGIKVEDLYADDFTNHDVDTLGPIKKECLEKIQYLNEDGCKALAVHANGLLAYEEYRADKPKKRQDLA